MIKTDYSKSLNDLGPERAERLSQKTNEKHQIQIEISRVLRDAPPRESCIVCQTKLQGSEFVHRSIPFIRCNKCGHIQTKGLPPAGYPYYEKNSSFHDIYPNLNAKEYQSRIERIYQPKLDWIHSILKDRFTKEELRLKKWTELGCGAGYFLSCLASNKYKKITGFDMDPGLVKKTDAMTPDYVKVYHGDLHKTVSNCSADVYVAFFVLEHVLDPFKFYQQLSHLPSNTIFIFSVPLFGISSMLEGVFDHLYARCLDTVFHTQIYTEKSIEYALNIADFEQIGQWVFGQDAEDFSRFILSSLRDNYPDDLFEEASTTLLDLQDPLQQLFDVNHLSDQRHIIAIKR